MDDRSDKAVQKPRYAPICYHTSMHETLCRDCFAISPDRQATCPDCGSARLVTHPELRRLTIAHIDCDAFYASVEKRDDPSLRGKPLIIGHAGGRGVVTTACYVARKYGPRSAMPMFKAMALCPDAVVKPPDMAKYKRVSRQIRELFHAATDLVEPVSIDEAYLDLGPGHCQDSTPAAAVLARLARRIEKDVGVTVSIGLSANKFLAKLASDLDKPRGYSVLGRAEAKQFLATLPVTKINGVGKATAERMERAGINSIGQLQELPEAELVARFGKFGQRLARYVHGEDDREVAPSSGSKSVSVETTFSSDIRDADQLGLELTLLCEKLEQRLRRSHLAGYSVTLKLKTHDFQTLTRSRQVGQPTQRASIISETALALLERVADGRAFRLIGVGVSDLTDDTAADPPSLLDLM